MNLYRCVMAYLPDGLNTEWHEASELVAAPDQTTASQLFFDVHKRAFERRGRVASDVRCKLVKRGIDISQGIRLELYRLVERKEITLVDGRAHVQEVMTA